MLSKWLLNCQDQASSILTYFTFNLVKRLKDKALQN